MRVTTVIRPDSGLSKCENCGFEIGNLYLNKSDEMFVSCVACGITKSEKPEVIKIKCTNCYHDEATVNLKDFKCSNCTKVMDVELPKPSVVSFPTEYRQ